jgi:hypothetical protein
MEELLEGLMEFSSVANEIVSSLGEATDHLRDLGPIAEFVRAAFERTGAQCEQIKADWESIQNDVLNIAAAFASQIEPAIDSLLKTVHNNIKDIGPALSEAIAEGKAGELLELMLKVAIEYAFSFIYNLLASPHYWKGIVDGMEGEFLIGIAAVEQGFLQSAVLFKTSFQWALDQIFELFGQKLVISLAAMSSLMSKLDPVAAQGMKMAAACIMATFGLEGGGGLDFADLYQQNWAKAGKALGKYAPGNTAEKGLDSYFQAGAEGRAVWEDALKNASAEDAPALAALKAQLIQQIQNPSTKPAGSVNRPDSWATHTSEAATEEAGLNRYRPEFTSLEKMGFIMSGSKVQNPYDQQKVSLLQRIVENTANLRGYSPPMDMRNAREIEGIQTMDMFNFNRI